MNMQSLPRSASRGILKSLSTIPSTSRAAFVCASCRSLQYQQPRIPSERQRRSFASCSPLRKTQSDLSSAPPPPPPSGHARLTTRRLISISGTGAPHFLQGLITTSIESNKTATLNGTIQAAQRTHWFYCGFLNALGRVLHDVFIYPVPSGSGGEPHFVIEVDASQHTTLLQHLKRFKLRSKIVLRAIEDDEMSVWQVWNDDAQAPLTGEAQNLPQNDGRSVVIPDLRAPGMGYRVLTVGPSLNVQDLDLPLDLQLADNEKTDEATYRVRRYLRGVPEGSAEIVPEQALPSESNMDVMGGIDFRKGCYVGQELTIRTRHRGVVRKRILPCVLYGEDEAVPTELKYEPDTASPLAGNGNDMHGLTIGRHGRKGRSTGTFLAGVGNIGLALCRVQLMTDLVVPNDTATLEFDPAAEFVIMPGKDKEQATAGADENKILKVKAFVPDWLRQRLNEDVVKHTQ
ncbi:Aminomethyltransferase folate-binding domain-containing protein [Xylariaceae sp. FL1651]|nr:Aminomethyltransferase folate-binding domain-containing protein [Xylariaceae sp. FL1651]